jgi:hypothetical protein
MPSSHASGAAIISVCTGAFQESELLSLKPDLCINSCAELLEVTSSSHS